MRCFATMLSIGFLLSVRVSFAEPVPAQLVKQTVDAAGGEAKLLRIFRIKEQLAVSSDPAAKGAPRTTVIEPPAHWWAGKRDRVTQEKEPAIFLVWAWTLGALVDPQSKLDTLPDGQEDGRATYGIRISGTINPAMDCFFDRETKRLVTILWRGDKHLFSDWREVDGTRYPAKCVGYKVATGKPWYRTEILELERLKERPADVQP